MVVSLYYNDDVMVISLLHLGMTPLCRVGSTVLAPPSLPYQISAVPVNTKIHKVCQTLSPANTRYKSKN